MDTGTIFLLAVVALLAMAFLFLFVTSRRRDVDRALSTLPDDVEPTTAPPVLATAQGTRTGRELERSVALERRREPPPSPTAPPPLPAIPDEESLGVTRRQVLNRGIVASMLVAISGFGGAMLAMLWPSLSGGFGAKIRAGSVEEVLSEIAEKKEPFYYAAGRFYINPYPKEAVGAAQDVTAYGALIPGFEAGLVAIYQKCVHLGCRVPWCKTSQWFECPCHGSKYNRVGEKKGGPAPRGLDQFPIELAGDQVTINTGIVVQGLAIGVETTGQQAEGPSCV